MAVEPRGWLLDLDGTLVDSEPYHKRAEITAFKLMGLEITADEILDCTGMTLSAMLDYVHRDFGFRTSVEEFLAVQQPIFTKIIEAEVELFPDVRPFLDRTADVPKVIVTSSLPWYVDVIRTKHPVLLDAFEGLICAADVENGKPHPEPFLLGASRLGLAPGHCWAVEDSVNGVNSALAAGCEVVGMDREGHGRLSTADRVVSSFDELA